MKNKNIKAQPDIDASKGIFMSQTRVQTEEEIDIREHFGRMWEILGQHVSEEMWSIIINDLEKADLLLCPKARRARNASILKHNAIRHE